MSFMIARSLACLFLTISLFSCGASVFADDWPDWRGPERNGISSEKGLPDRWSPGADDLAWRAPYGGRSGPIVMGDRVYLQNSSGQGEALQERVMCLDVGNGTVLWEYRFNVYLSDVPPHRVGWASPVGDPKTGSVYAFGVGGTLLALSRDGKLLWERSLAEDFGLVTTHGGRTVSPVIEGDLLILSGITTGWGDQARAAHRFMAFDKKTGQTVWVSSPGGRPFDTTYSPPTAAEIGGTRLLIAGGSDGTIHALKPQTGEPVWKYVISKRGINTGAVLKGTTAIVSHSEENLDSSEMGLLAAIDASAKGEIGKDQIKWSKLGLQGGFSSPVIDGDRIYQIDNGANLHAFNVATGSQLWTQNLGTIQKSSPVLADGKLYVGTENGKFFILKPTQDGCQILDEDLLGTELAPETIIGSVAVSNGRIFLVSSEALYCIGKKRSAPTKSGAAAKKNPPSQLRGSDTSGSGGAASHVQVVPTELVLQPGERVHFESHLFDAQGRFLRKEQAAWTLDQLRGEIDTTGQFVAATDKVAQAGLVKANVGPLSGVARVRIIPPLPWSENFESLGTVVPRHWINATGKFAMRELEGNKVLVKLADNPFTKRARAFMGFSNWSNYTVEVDMRATEKRRQMGDAGVVAQRYALILFGNHQRLELESWQPETARTVKIPFAWKPETWYCLKLEVQNLTDGKVRARGKVWPAAEPEPEVWSVEKVDSIPNRQGSPGIYADAPFEIFFDNLKVIPNS